jgi:hypothetical protein
MGSFLRRYFGLGLLEPKLVLGPDQSQRISFGAIVLVLLMYLGVFLGVIAEYVLESLRSSGADTISIGLAGFYKGWLVATLLFPLVCPKIFNMSGFGSGAGPIEGNSLMGRALQFFVAFENGFFWQAVLM